jgi:hypothetical protein
MPAGLPVAMILLAQAAAASPEPGQPAYGPAAPAAKPAPPPAKIPECPQANPDPNSREIVVCAERPQGYRIDPDVLKARREAHNRTKPKPPERMVDTTCKVVGPAPCIGATPGINLIAAAATAAEMAKRLADGQEIGSMFVTDPTPSEYQLYLEAKREREAKEKAKAEQDIVAKAKAEAQASKSTEQSPAK